MDKPIQQVSSSAITISDDPDGVLKIAGDLDINDAEALRGALLDWFDDRPAATVDLSAAGSCDAAILQVLFAARRSGRVSGRSIRFTGIPAAVVESARDLGLRIEELAGDPEAGPEGHSSEPC